VITTEQAVLFSGPAATLEEAWQHPDTLIHFPLCWQACLFGSRRLFDIETQKFCSEDLQRLRSQSRTLKLSGICSQIGAGQAPLLSKNLRS
jgi:hypothetical protein